MEHFLRHLLSQNEAFRKLSEAVRDLRAGENREVTGVAGSLRASLIGALHEVTARPLLVVTSTKDDAERLADDLSAMASGAVFHLFRGSTGSSTLLADRSHAVLDVQTLRAAAADHPAGIVTHPAALGRLLPQPDSVIAQSLTLTTGDRCVLTHTVELLDDLSFERKDFVEQPGDYAWRGGILDVFPFVGENPIRVEFLDDVVESLREFDALSQRSIRELSSALVLPDVLSRAAQEGTPGEHAGTLFDYLPPATLLVLEEPDLLPAALRARGIEEPEHTLSPDTVEARLSGFPTVSICAIARSRDAIDFASHSQPSFNGSVRTLSEDLAKRISAGYRVIMTCDNQAEMNRLRDLLRAVREAAEDGSTCEPDQITFSLHNVHDGFILAHPPTVVYTEHQIFGRLRRRGRRRRPKFKGFTEAELHQLRKGDYVVHEDYGVGRFAGLKRIRVRNVEMEVAVVQYEEKDTLYVNISYINKLQKYSSKDGHVPKLNKLGSGDWERLKARTKKRVKDIARDLIGIYARRKHLPGFAFAEDTPWQRELEASFMYEDTFDQARTTQDVKRDMESAAPMDRLICGDVGFGKTEIAVRAAFKAVLAGKQVAILVPTTILAMQHYNTFVDRTARYGLAIESLSRFKPRKDQLATLERLGAGGIDILIGTHRLLSKDVRFKDLGLLIIDEEHRFGVAAKEKLRALRSQVDTLALTATPIPRTLHFSLLGARDLSVIATPPRNRLPIITEITQWDDEVIRDGVFREMQRGGQVYFVHDRVQTIEDVAARLRGILPGVRIGVAHGQMTAHDLEQVMMTFLEKRIDILVSTKIIESGLDIPNVNTIIVNRADHFGMAELYQLRGRVGRSNIQAYAYLLTPPISVLPRSTLQRLQALQEFNELGSGFNLAMRDMEIRGVGNLLGSEQSGFIETMGFETYSRVLEEAVRELKEEEFQTLFRDELQQRPPARECVVEAEIDAFLPESYVNSDTERMTIYRRLYTLSTDKQLQEIAEELKDRFGTFPAQVHNLLALVRLKLAAAKIGFSKVHVGIERMEAVFPPETDTQFYESDNFQNLMTAIAHMREKGVVLMQDEKVLTVSLPLPPSEDVERQLLGALQSLQRFDLTASAT